MSNSRAREEAVDRETETKEEREKNGGRKGGRVTEEIKNYSLGAQLS